MIQTMLPAYDKQTIRIADNGQHLTLDYNGARAEHDGDSWWGLAVGFRAMQVASAKLSETKLWDREQINVMSRHPGPGVRDAINYVTRCVERNRFRLYDISRSAIGCSSDMQYEWLVSDGELRVDINLRPDFVPEPFYELLDRLGTYEERADDLNNFGVFKDVLEARIWQEPLTSSFTTKCSAAQVTPGCR